MAGPGSLCQRAACVPHSACMYWRVYLCLCAAWEVNLPRTYVKHGTPACPPSFLVLLVVAIVYRSVMAPTLRSARVPVPVPPSFTSPTSVHQSSPACGDYGASAFGHLASCVDVGGIGSNEGIPTHTVVRTFLT